MQNQRNELNFEGENIYVGIDVHLKSWTVTILTEHTLHKTFRQDPSPMVLANYLWRTFPGAIYFSAYEAGFCGLWIHNQLTEMKIQNIVVNPADIPSSQKELQQKTDAVDSNKIARTLRAGQLKGIYTHSLSTLEARCLVRLRASIVKDNSRIKNQIKGLLNFYGVKYPIEFTSTNTHWSANFIRWLRQDVMQKEVIAKDALNLLLEEFEHRRIQVLRVTRKIRSLSQSEHWKEDMELIRSIPGIGLITGITFLVNIEKISRFQNTDKFASFIGLIPTCHSSGEKENKGEITGRSQSEMRGLLVESAWIAARRDPALTLCFNKLCHRMESNKAIIRIARKLSNRIYSVLKNKKEYVTGVLC